MTESNITIHPGFLPTRKFLDFLDTLPPTPKRAAALAKQEAERKSKAQADFAEREADRLRVKAETEQAEGKEAKRRGPYGPRERHEVRGRVHYMEDDVKYRAWR